MNILVLAGGLSPERDVSLSSGSRDQPPLLSNADTALPMIDVYTDLGELPRFFG